MNESLFSQSWYRVADLQPRLRSHVRILRHTYRGEDWYVIQDQFTGKHHRFSPEAYQVIGLMDGQRRLQQIWEQACKELGDHMPTQDEIINLLSLLFRSDLLQSSALPDFSELQQRSRKGKLNRLLMNLRSPMSVRFPLLDPDRFLSSTLAFVSPFLGRSAGLIWLITLLTSIILAVIHWPDLTKSITDSLLSLENIFLITLLYPLLKLMHEFGHAYLVKKWGGEVHEMGIMLLVFMPIPYVEASSSLAFDNKYRRMAVGAIGIMVELFSAAVALLVWLNVEPGIVRAVAFNTMLIAGVSTLLFNGNPLLRFDAYYVLSDFLEIPNLGQRANKYIAYLCKRYLLGLEHEEPNTQSTGEARWLFFYAAASFVYRIFLSIRIILFVAGKFFFVGIILALWAGYGMVVAPVLRIVQYLVRDSYMRRNQVRIFWAICLPLIVLLASFFFVPFPFYTHCEGVTWAPDEAQVYAGADGFVTDIFVEDGMMVEQGTLLLKAEDPGLTAGVKLLEGMLFEYQSRYEHAFQVDRIESGLIQEEIERIIAELERAKERQQALQIKSPLAGQFIIKEPDRLQDRFVSRGLLLGYIINQDNMRLRVVVPQAGIERVREDTQKVDIRLARDINKTFSASVIREVPAASRTLPSMALSLEGGGRFALDPRSKETPKVLENLFQFDLQAHDSSLNSIDERVYVRFQHQPEPLAYRWYRNVRRLLLSKFSF